LNFKYDGQKIEDPRIVVIRIRNSGKQPIVEDDFQAGRPITVQYASNRPFTAMVTDMSDGLGPDSVVFADDREARFAILPRLLNPKEWFQVQMMSAGKHGDIAVGCRLAGQTRQMKRKSPASLLGTPLDFVFCYSRQC